MNRQRDVLGVGERVGFFDYIFERGVQGARSRKPIAVMIFKKSEAPLPVVHNSEYHDNRVTHIHQSDSETINYRYPEMHLTSSQNFISNRSHQRIQHITNRYDAHHMKFLPAVTEKHDSFYHREGDSYTIAHPLHFDNRVEKRQPVTRPVEKASFKTAAEQQVMVYHKESESVGSDTMKALEERVVTRVTEKIKVQTQERHTHTFTKEERIVRQREEKALSDKLYASVMKKWDRELKRRGHLYG
ncbi:hypothetical protein [Sulfurovum mangrovi]|uniref:hypothetical protein n=1 Tax=Sulfurovum mangrovi TaxID=2893889 RepID=UPI001E5FBB2E|nr:hypothetical protein [Sulfurovum mangrovi]UFH59978.1 hypothetical protein LN246_03805 [Sulfurovum mangrovi]